MSITLLQQLWFKKYHVGDAQKMNFPIKDIFIFLCSECEDGINTETEMGLLVSEDLNYFAKWIFKKKVSRISYVEALKPAAVFDTECTDWYFSHALPISLRVEA